METDYRDTSSSSSSDDESEVVNFYSSEDNNSDDERDPKCLSFEESCQTAGQSEISYTQVGSVNIVHKLLNRERFGNFTGTNRACHYQPRVFPKVPSRLQICLKDILSFTQAESQIFMGLSACGQFILSYKIVTMDQSNVTSYSFNNSYKYTLYFWKFKPGEPLKTYYTRRLFDDHGVDNFKIVTMVQWKCSESRILVVHGQAQDDEEDSYISYIRIPKLGCQDCIKIRDTDSDGLGNTFCLKCNLTVHTKYSTVESDRKFDPYFNLLCPDRIFIISNGFMHLLNIEVDNPPSPIYVSSPCSTLKFAQVAMSPINLIFSQESNEMFNIYNDLKSPLDASDVETASIASNEGCQTSLNTNDYSPRRIFTSNNRSVASASNNSTTETTVTTESQNTTRRRSRLDLLKHRDRKARIFTKRFRKGVLSVDLQGGNLPSTSSGCQSSDKSSAYEFCEENEKCEKISTLRKRRLAEKKYEFSEDNTENIVPFTKMRKTASPSTRFNSSPTSSNSSGRAALIGSPYSLSFSPCPSPTYSPLPAHASPTSNHCSSPILSLGLRSPQPSGSQLNFPTLRSPSRNSNTPSTLNNQWSPQSNVVASSQLSQATQQMLSFKPLGALSPIQVSMTRRSNLDTNFMSPNANLVEVNLQGGTFPEKPICVKQLQRRYVEEDDAATVITSEEDDCISPGYHTSMPLEVHGSGYSAMHMISKASYAQLNCPSVLVTQHSFDLETFTYYQISTLCQKNEKTYEMFVDWASDVVTICPITKTAICLLLAHFSAKDQILTTSQSNCFNCNRKMDCAFHRKEYQCRILFAWHMEDDEWEVLDYGEMKEYESKDKSSPHKRFGLPKYSLASNLNYLINDMKKSLPNLTHSTDYLRVFDTNIKKPKASMVDLDNMIELHLKRKCRHKNHH